MTSTKRLSHKRGPYKRYSSSVKEDALKLISEGHSVRNVCLRMGIPKKNLKRWIDMGSERKKGGGRKRMDEQMEHDLYKWCIEEGVKLGRPVSRKMIR
jgi:transposase-like protein